LDLVARLLGAVTVVVLIRALSVSNYAFMTLFLTLAQLGGSAAAGGVRTRYLREEAERVSRNAPASAGAFTAALAATVALTSAAAILGMPIAATVGLGHHAGGDIALIFYAFGYAVSWAVIELSMARMQARRRFLAAGLLNVTRAAAVAVAALIVASASQRLPALAVWFIALLAVVAVGAAASAVRESGYRVRSLARVLGMTAEERWLSFYYLAAAGFAYVDVVVASALLGQKEIATLGAALRYLAVILGALPALGVILRVRTAQADVVDSAAAQLRMVIGWIKRIGPPALLLMGAAIGVAPTVIPVIDRGRYPGSIVAFQIYLVMALATYLVAPSVAVLMAQRRYRFLATRYGICLCINVLGDAAVARRFGVTGIATVSTSLFSILGPVLVLGALRQARRAVQ
jgi:O-antigen/teichoic acid export membrane protein